jgi:hypothetical protein
VYIVALVFVELAVKAPLYLRRRGRLHRSGAAPARARPRRAEQVHEQHACNRGHPSGADPGYEVVHDKEAARMQLLVEPAPYGETEAWAYVQLGWRLALLCLHAAGGPDGLSRWCFVSTPTPHRLSSPATAATTCSSCTGRSVVTVPYHACCCFNIFLFRCTCVFAHQLFVPTPTSWEEQKPLV